MRSNKMARLGVAALAVVAIAVGVSGPADARIDPDITARSAAALTEASVTGWHVKDGTLYGADLAPGMVPWFTNTYDNTVRSVSIVDGSVQQKDLAPSVQEQLVSDLESDSPYPGGDNPPLQDIAGDNGEQSTLKFKGDGGATLQRAWVRCAGDKVAVGGGFQRGDEAVAEIKNLQVVSSGPTQIEAGKEVYKPITGDQAGSLVPNAWLVEGFNNGTTDLVVRPSVICANLG